MPRRTFILNPVAAYAANLPDSAPNTSDNNAITIISAPHITMNSVRDATVNSGVSEAPSCKTKV